MMPPEGRDPTILGPALAVLLGPVVWAVHLGLVYGFHHIACRLRAGSGSAATVTLLATAVAGAVLVAAVLWPGRLGRLLRAWHDDSEVTRFMASTMRLLALLSLFGVVWAGGAVFFVSDCTGSP